MGVFLLHVEDATRNVRDVMMFALREEFIKKFHSAFRGGGGRSVAKGGVPKCTSLFNYRVFLNEYVPQRDGKDSKNDYKPKKTKDDSSESKNQSVNLHLTTALLCPKDTDQNTQSLP